tara:strand:- start:11529 stop:12539 length:1011 start_codon:yes stop_codon:yes gene_type:complete
MTHEFKKLVQAYLLAKEQGIKTVLATVVALDGSSYRKPGVRMLLLETGQMIGAVSGGCVEKEILLKSNSVFESSIPKIITYDGRYRLGCEGVLYILIEPFNLSPLFIETFTKVIKDRVNFKISSFYKREEIIEIGLGTRVQFQNITLPVSLKHAINPDLKVFEDKMTPCFRLLIYGAEHDAVLLCSFASMMGWEVAIIVHPFEEKNSTNFPGATAFQMSTPEAYQAVDIDSQTAVVIMNHNFSKDLLFLMALKATKPAYIGLLGPTKRREQLFDALLERNPDISDSFLESIYGPAGLNIGSITPQEIAISILSEILSVVRKETPSFLKDKLKSIHN